MKTFLSAALLAAALIGTGGPAVAANASDHCVSVGEFDHLSLNQTKAGMERNWGVRGRAKWIQHLSTPGYDAYSYPSCSPDYSFRIAFTRGDRTVYWMQSEH